MGVALFVVYLNFNHQKNYSKMAHAIAFCSFLDIQQTKFIRSRQGNRMLCVGNYKFSHHKCTSRAPMDRWVCTKTRCKASVKTFQDNIVFCNNVHNH